jgi:hypothetical protein
MCEDDLFHLTRQGRTGERHGCSVAVKSLLGHLGVPPNAAARELKIVAQDRGNRSISVILPAVASPEVSNVEAEDVAPPVEVHRGFNGN